MNAAKAILSLTVFVLAATASASALAWHQARFGVYIGGPAYWYPPYYYPPYYPPYYPAYGYPPAVVAPSAPPVYVEQAGGAPAAAPPQSQSASQSPPQSGWWYYCGEAKAYYPYVKECPTGWQRIAPQPQQ
jgi:hypothetical protein